MSQIEVKSNNKEIHGDASRVIMVSEPTVLTLTTVEELVAALGEDLVVNQIKAQLKVAFRAVIRRKLDEIDDNGNCINSDESILNEDYSDWKPQLRITKSPEEKAREALGNLPPEVRDAVLAQFQNAGE